MHNAVVPSIPRNAFGDRPLAADKAAAYLGVSPHRLGVGKIISFLWLAVRCQSGSRCCSDSTPGWDLFLDFATIRQVASTATSAPIHRP